MAIILPPPFRKNKLKIYRNFSLGDVLVLIGLAGFVLTLVSLLPIPTLAKLFTTVALSVPVVLALFWNHKHDCRNYALLGRWFKNSAYTKTFISRAARQNLTKVPRKAGYSDDLVALTSIDYSPLAPAVAVAKYQTLKHGPGYWAALKITGLDISHFGPPERERAYDNLAAILKTIQFRFSLIKISKRYDLSANQSFLQQKTERTAGTAALDQINAAYEQALTAFQSETLENNYYLVAYAKQLGTLVSHITNLQSELEQDGFGTRCLSRAQSLQLQLEIINNYANLDLADFMLEPQHDEQTNTTIPAITIAQVLAFAQIRFGNQ